MARALKRPVILAQTGLVLEDQVHIAGQLHSLKERHYKLHEHESFWRHLYRLLTSYLKKKVGVHKVTVSFGEDQNTVFTDKSGYFETRVELSSPPASNISDLLRYTLPAIGEDVYIPEICLENVYDIRKVKKAVISDIDDTVLVSHAFHPMRKLYTLAKNTAFKRKEVSDMGDLYRWLEGQDYFVFYVSNSEMNLYPMIQSFLDFNEFPSGPLYLTKYKRFRSMLKKKKKSRINDHKFDTIRSMMDMLPDTEFILVGDSGQRDAYIYSSFAAEYPDQIRAIVIRNIHRKKESKKLKPHKIKSEKANVPFYVVQSGSEARELLAGRKTVTPSHTH